MNCPKCGAVARGGTRAIAAYFDSENGEYFRRCRCSKCKALFYTIEYEVEPTEFMLTNLAPVKGVDLKTRERSSRERFESYNSLKKQVQRNKRSRK